MTPAEIPIPSFAPPAKWLSGIHNCHVPGLNSYVLRGRADEKVGMVRVFHNEGDHHGTNFLGQLLQQNPDECRQEYMLLPHNHRQAIRLIPVRGNVVNVTFDLDRMSHDHYITEWRFESAILTGKAELHYRDSIDMAVRDIVPLSPEGVALACHEVHTVIASVGAVWLVVEGELAPLSQQSRCYSRRNDFALPDGLYRSMDSFTFGTAERQEILRECGDVLWRCRDLDEEVQRA